MTETDLASLAAPAHSREVERLALLARYNVLDTPREEDFDDIAALAAQICGTPIAVVNLVADGRQWLKAEVGLGVRETSLETSFCGHALLEADYMEVPDATRDPRFDCNPLVAGGPGLRFYAGALLKGDGGLPIGTLCVLDTRPRTLDYQQRRALTRLARQVMSQLELRRAMRLQDLLSRELQHRLKNTLAMVQAIAGQTFRGAILPRLTQAFTARLIALGQAQDVLTWSSWSAAPIREVVEGALAAHRTGQGRFAVDGPDLRLGAQPALALSLAIHALATNAAKYGALRAEGGRVTVSWQIDRERFRLLWRESGGPPVVPPRTKGFGSRLIERNLAMEFQGRVDLDFAPAGVTCELVAPLDALGDD